MTSPVYNSTSEQIWVRLIRHGLTKNAAAAVLSFITSQSTVISFRVSGDFTSSFTTSNEYTAKVNTRIIDQVAFATEGPHGNGYGLFCWNNPRTKSELYAQTVDAGKAIQDINTQIDIAIDEFKKISTLWPTLTSEDYSIAACCNVLINDYHSSMPLRDSNAKIIEVAQQYYNRYLYVSTATIFSQKNLVTTVLNIALGEVGTKEEGNNRVKYNRWFWGYEAETAWCMAFVQWCFNQAGIKLYKTASCSTLWANTTQDCIIPRDQLQPGDIILFSLDESIESAINRMDADHVGIVVESPGNGTYITVEGNTGPPSGSQDNGDGVYRKTRYLNQPTLRTGGGIICGLRFVEGGTEQVNYFQNVITPFQEYLARFADKIENQYNSAIEEPTYSQGSAFSEKQVEVTKFVDKIITVDRDANIARVKGTSLLTTPTLVESPFIILKVGKYKFGSYVKTNKYDTEKMQDRYEVTYPNYMTSIDIVKINGVVNQYTIQMVYQIQAGQDPNLIDKIFSKVGYGTVYISYGDWMSRNFIYKEEEAIITNLTSNVDFANSRITYTLKCTSNAIALLGGYYNFSATEAKPSDLLYNMLYGSNSTYKLLDSFPGKKNRDLVKSKGLIRSDDAVVKIEAKQGMDALSYVNYLVSCMTDLESSTEGLRRSNYYLTICDDNSGEFGGTYFKITKMTRDINSISLDTSNTYEVDIGYPGDTLVTNFNIVNDNSWALLYNYSQEVLPETYTYNIDDSGNIIQTSSPNIMLSSNYNRVTETQRSWWTEMTQFPITATLEIKGLVRPALLMTYVRINALFYGQRHTSSGLYVITKQEDKIDANGYRTILSLTRVAGDLDVIKTTQETYTVTIKEPDTSVMNPSEKARWERENDRDTYDERVRNRYRYNHPLSS